MREQAKDHCGKGIEELNGAPFMSMRIRYSRITGAKNIGPDVRETK
jgi:hypothetical protein